ncbi:MAG TPA: glycosyltransferase family 1 protein [Burkholderiales bacterium]|nr:glycosyltransferase family 1 protein [Burkholderiales bacterium]
MPEILTPIEFQELLRPRRSLRVAVVTETYPPEINGVSLTAARFVEGLRERNHEIQLIRPRQNRAEPAASNEHFQELLTQGMPIPRYPNLRMGLPAKRALEQAWAFRRPDVVHIVTEGPLGWSALRAARKLKLPVVSDFRTNFHAYSRHYGIAWLGKPILAYLRKFHNRTLFTLVPTDALRAELAALGFRGLRVVARGVDTALFNPARRSQALRASWGAGPDDPVLLHVGRLAPEKNIDGLLDAYAAARGREPRARLVLVGDGPAREDLRSRCPDAIFAGMQRGEYLAAHYASADLFLFPSLTETYGNVTLEALASGLAVVAYDYAAGAALIRSGENGLLAALGDAQDFRALAAGLAADPLRVRALGERARERALAYDWRRAVRQLETVLEVAAGATTVHYGTSGDGRTQAPMPQST